MKAEILKKLPSVTIYDTSCQPLPNAAFAWAAPVTRCVLAYLPTYPLTQSDWISHSSLRCLVCWRCRTWSSDATELPAADIFLNMESLASVPKTLCFASAVVQWWKDQERSRWTTTEGDGAVSVLQSQWTWMTRAWLRMMVQNNSPWLLLLLCLIVPQLNAVPIE